MNFKVLTIPPFDKQLKRLVKKYPSLKAEIVALVTELQSNPKTGIAIGNDCYKIRIALASKGKGKSGGARITHIWQLAKLKYISCQFTIKLNNPTLVKKNYCNYWRELLTNSKFHSIFQHPASPPVHSNL